MDRALFVKNLRYVFATIPRSGRNGLANLTVATTLRQRNSSTSSANSAPFGMDPIPRSSSIRPHADLLRSQVRQGIATNTKGTAFVVYEDVMDAKQACDKLNGFNFQNRYLVGALISFAGDLPVVFPFT